MLNSRLLLEFLLQVLRCAIIFYDIDLSVKRDKLQRRFAKYSLLIVRHRRRRRDTRFQRWLRIFEIKFARIKTKFVS